MIRFLTAPFQELVLAGRAAAARGFGGGSGSSKRSTTARSRRFRGLRPQTPAWVADDSPLRRSSSLPSATVDRPAGDDAESAAIDAPEAISREGEPRLPRTVLSGRLALAGFAGLSASGLVAATTPLWAHGWRTAILPIALVGLAAAFAIDRFRRVAARSSPSRGATAETVRAGEPDRPSRGGASLVDAEVTSVPDRQHVRRAHRRSGPSRHHGVSAPLQAGASGRDADQVRRHVRIRPRQRSVVVTTDGGITLTAAVLDLSQSGVALDGTMSGVWVGSMVTVGSRRAKAVRTLPQGMAFEFSVPIAESELDAETVL